MVGAGGHQSSLWQASIIGIEGDKVLPGSRGLDMVLLQRICFGQVVPRLLGLLVRGAIVQHAQVVGNGLVIVAVELMTLPCFKLSTRFRCRAGRGC